MNGQKTYSPIDRSEERADNFNRLFAYDVVDKNDKHIGNISAIWADPAGQPAFIGLKTWWLTGKTHIVPARDVTVSHEDMRVRVPYDEEMVKNSPTHDPDAELDAGKLSEINSYYHLEQPTGREAGFETAGAEAGATREPVQERPTARPATGQEEVTIPLSEEELRVGKREVVAGGVRLRKIVRTERVEQPVELRREDVEVERVPSEGGAPSEATFREQEVEIPIRREEPVVEKEARVREEVRVHKRPETHRETVSGTVRREDVEVLQGTQAGEETERERELTPEERRAREERPEDRRGTT